MRAHKSERRYNVGYYGEYDSRRFSQRRECALRDSASEPRREAQKKNGARHYLKRRLSSGCLAPLYLIE